jgi:hypothetical protein
VNYSIPKAAWGFYFFSIAPVKPAAGKRRSLTNKEREQFTLSQKLKQIAVGLLLGDLNAEKQKTSKNVRLRFVQGTVHKEYLLDLFERFKDYCPVDPKIINHLPDKITGKVHSSIRFSTYSLPCFNEFYDLFYPEGIKIVPQNIAELITPIGLAFLFLLIMADGY